jgi:hypothetical protein
MKYITVELDVLRNASGSDCTLGGVSSKHSKVVMLIPDTLSDIIERVGGKLKTLEDLRPADNWVVLSKEIIFSEPYYFLKPYNETRWCMMGGNFAYCCGNGFREIVGYPLPIHDRVEI